VRLDWKDGLLFAAGFVLVIVICSSAAAFGVGVDRWSMRGFVYTLAVGPIAARRFIFGAPALPAPRTGVFASLLSIGGLFATLFGTAAFAFGTHTLVGSYAAAPDFDEQVRELESSAMSIDVSRSDEDPAAHAARRQAEARVRHDELVATERDVWLENRRGLRHTGLLVCGVAVVLLAAGSLALWARYPRV
jgi:hypothetical protein